MNWRRLFRARRIVLPERAEPLTADELREMQMRHELALRQISDPAARARLAAIYAEARGRAAGG
jgi:DNA-binding TFAR19-related protein (PDSD5 family)